jgi:hypothetical protein
MLTNGVSRRSWLWTSPAIRVSSHGQDEAQTSRDLKGHAGVVLSIIASDTIEIAYNWGARANGGYGTNSGPSHGGSCRGAIRPCATLP